MTAVGEFGVYVHVPFCRSRCDYCAFATYDDRHHLTDAYVEACLSEMAAAAGEGMPPATSVFFGGGTPSLLPVELLAALVGAVERAPGAEVTVECNPEDVTAARVAAYVDAGVTRISVGVQSTDPAVLAGLGRRHTPGAVDQALDVLGTSGLTSWNVDLIFGGPGEGPGEQPGGGAGEGGSWDSVLASIVSRDRPPPHVSAYALTVEPGTPLAADPRRHPDPDVLAVRYEATERILTAAGYRWEEISNWARPGHGCRHNRLYWRQGDYRGFGSAAHSHLDGRRWWNVRTPDRYIRSMAAGQSPVGGEEVLDGEQRRFERWALALRTPAGVPEEVLPPAPELEGLVEWRDGLAVLTVAGRLVADDITCRIRAEAAPGS